ncbi:MAG TPA: hypothetical protein PLW94_01415 [Candidatus Absconditabacterales bacterium]|nr:hypothetical protein [Candidatus Absconditabacterales bacterium]
MGSVLFVFAETGKQENIEEEKLAQIMIDTGTNTIYISGYVSTGTTSGVIDTGKIEEPPVLINNEPKDLETEFSEALAWMYANGLTKYDNKEDYRMFDLVSREEAGKIIGQAYVALGYPDIEKNSSCDFGDASKFNPSLAPHIANVCKRGLFKGSNGNYMPLNNLTKAEAMAVLLRMFEGKMSYELQIPWREQYYTKGKLIGLTNIEDINKFDKGLERYEIALMVHRLRSIVTNPQLKTMALNLLGQVLTPNTVGIMDGGTVIANLDTLVGGIDPYKDPELLEAIYRMYDNALTIHKNPNDYRPFDTLNKVAAAKIFDKFSTMLSLSGSEAFLPNQCEFTDIGDLSNEDQQYIVNVCKKGIMKGNNKKFVPDSKLNKSHFVVSLVRMFQGKYLDENVSPWWQNYFNEAKELGIVVPSDAITFDTPISRYEVALFLYKFNIKYKMLSNLNNDRIANEIISTVEGSISTGINGKLKSNVYLDSNLLKRGSFDLGYIETLGTRYKIVKSSESTYFADNFVWYGNVFDLASDEELGTINFVVSNGGYVIEATIRFDGGDTYKILPIQGTSAYYLLQVL